MHVPKGVPQHETFHFDVINAAPAGPGQEGPTNFDLAERLVVAEEPRRADDTTVFAVSGDQRTFRFQCFAKEACENVFLMAIPDGMLLPNPRI
jgi:hypothetical protein